MLIHNCTAKPRRGQNPPSTQFALYQHLRQTADDPGWDKAIGWYREHGKVQCKEETRESSLSSLSHCYKISEITSQTLKISLDYQDIARTGRTRCVYGSMVIVCG